MSDTEQTAALVEALKKAMAESSRQDPRERFQAMVEAGLIDSDGRLVVLDDDLVARLGES